MDDDLFSTEIVSENCEPPLIVVGLPRSGSSFFSEVLSQSGVFTFDDLYLQDEAKHIDARGNLSGAQLSKLLFFLGWQIRARLRFGLYVKPQMTEEEVEPMNDALKKTFSGKEVTWFELQKEWLVRLAHRSGRQKWGYKMPRAFRSVDSLRDAYPGAKFVWLMRHPHDVLASYKHMSPGSQDGDPDQYHVLAHAWYWRMAAKKYFAVKGRLGSDVELVLFEELVGDPRSVGDKMASFLGIDEVNNLSLPERSNTSFSGTRKSVNGLEAALINWICWPVAGRLGYSTRSCPRKWNDIVDFIERTYRFSYFRLVTKPSQKRNS